MHQRIIYHVLGAILLLAAWRTAGDVVPLKDAQVSASSSASERQPLGAVDGARFSTEPAHGWQGISGAQGWWWQIQFEIPRKIGAISQVFGDHPFVLRNAPRTYVWQWSNDGRQWHDLGSTWTLRERRLFHVHRLPEAQSIQYLRMQISAVTGDCPTLREIEFYSDPAEAIPFPDWIVAVNTTDRPTLPGHGQEFIPLAQSCAGWGQTLAQQVWLADFDESFIHVEPRPLCAFLSGNFKDWCEIAREPWRGTQEILRNRSLPLWASCGGAQGLAILAETGVDQPWDCPHCRNPQFPRTPIYTHIGHTGTRLCGDYSACVFERGPHSIKQVIHDPVFEGLPDSFLAMESHCGQIEWPPKGWQLIGTGGEGTLTKSQCLRLEGYYIYAAQFHIEMEGTPDVSRRIMRNFLGLAKAWNQANGKVEHRPQPVP